MKKPLLFFIFLMIGVTFLINDFRSAFAQEGAQEEYLLDEIMVTAQKREQSLHEVPIAISVTTSDQLERQQIYSARDLERTTPALEFGNSGPAGAPTIRGIGTTAVVGGIGEPSVGINIDGITQGAAVLNSLFDVQRIEVLRGPQGTLYGDTSSAGLINIISNSPDPLGFDAKVGFDITDDGTLGSKFSRQEYRGMLNIPVNENSALRAVFNFNDMDGLRKNKLGPDFTSKDYGARLHYLYEPTDDFSLDLIGNYHKTESKGPSIFTPVTSVTPIHQAALAECGITASPENQYTCHDFDEHNTIEFYTLSAEFNFKAFGHEITSITGYTEHETGPWNWQILGLSYPGLLEIRSSGQVSTVKRYTTDLRIASPKGQKVEYIAGLWYNGSDRSQDELAYSELRLPIPIPGFPPVLSHSNLTKGEDKNYAVYGNADIHFTDAFTVFAGARFARYDLWTTSINMQEPAPPEYVPIGAETTASLKEDYFSYRLGGQYNINEDWMVYLNTSNAVKTPSVSEPPFTDPTADPKVIKAEISTNYEIGIKGKIFDGKLALESNAFYTTLEDFQGTECYLSPETQELSCVVANVQDDIISKGFEISLYGFPMRGLRVNTGYIFNIAEYPDGYPSDDEPPQDLGGEQLMNAPRHKFLVSTEYSHSLTDNLDGFVSVDATYKTKRRLSLMADSFSVYRAHWMVGARMGIRAQDNWSVTLFARNIFGEAAPAALWPANDGNNYQIVTPTQFRQVGLSLNYSF